MFIIPQSAAPRAVGPPCLGSPHLTERFGAARTRTTPLICGSAAGYQVADRARHAHRGSAQAALALLRPGPPQPRQPAMTRPAGKTKAPPPDSARSLKCVTPAVCPKATALSGSLRPARPRQSAVSAQGRRPKPRCPHRALRPQRAQPSQGRVRHHVAGWGHQSAEG